MRGARLHLFMIICLWWGLAALLPAPVAYGQAPASPPARPLILEFGHSWCANCRQMEGILAQIKSRYGDRLEIRLVDVEKEPGLMAQYNISQLPTQVLIDAAGKEVLRHTGVFPLELLETRLRELKFIRD